MPKFTENEKEQIRQDLFVKGREIFIKYGLAKTSIDEIIRECGIAKGTFYKFFSSKEELYFEILINEVEVRETVLNELFRENLSSRELLNSFFHFSFDSVDKNPFLQSAFQNDEHEKLTRKLPAQMSEFNQNNAKRGIHAVNALINQGMLPKEDPRVIVGIMQAVMSLRLHKKDIGDDIFPIVKDKIIEFVIEGLLKEKN
ncbi:TetR/AcrR family transcriptional regulator [Lysinibacillus irui]|uniref:TetR/AcrR family transcriptional regulator n=1 Tax=Lysinibacillus irui TaxID=2998077 RepID=A0ABU5NSB0_9BACI|nr:TetR/AcrR family transcriptional regulator [Lysinibacillus irui]MEA0553345.1 TetR/AcrR family transcriptional regulator [Lysinibacillus irui]MEA0978895.1 TetR/AcrR family transcriptional regulator [Lysinibacillus irui]MEA1045049.1 TetR/AcrR family transcriptional regulator [Lysinibacillus irui]